MTDIQKLKALAEEVRDTGDMCALIEFAKATNPSVVLELIGRISKLEYSQQALTEQCEQLIAVNFDYQLNAQAADEEIARLGAENADYKAGQQRYEDISEAQRKRIWRLEDRLSRRDVWSNPRVAPVKPILSEPHPLELTMGPGARSGSIQCSRNQCDGCQAGIPVVRGMHRMSAIGRYPDLMACTARLYKPETDQKPGGVET